MIKAGYNYKSILARWRSASNFPMVESSRQRTCIYFAESELKRVTEPSIPILNSNDGTMGAERMDGKICKRCCYGYY